MKKLQFKTNINAPIAKVYNTMLGLDNKATYEAWTAEFTQLPPMKEAGKREQKSFLSVQVKTGEKAEWSLKLRRIFQTNLFPFVLTGF